jgi:phosphoribosyl 1,2-cyclic phosphodiesterase
MDRVRRSHALTFRPYRGGWYRRLVGVPKKERFVSRTQDRKARPETIACHFGEQYAIGDFQIEAFATSHDAAEPCGFVIREGDLGIGSCTDTGVVTDAMLARFRQCDAVILESNHCPVMLREGPYPEMLKRRIRSKHGHLSNTVTAGCLQALGRDVSHIVLAHLSEVNNTPEKAKASAMTGLGLYMNEVCLTVETQAGSTPDAPQQIVL